MSAPWGMQHQTGARQHHQRRSRKPSQLLESQWRAALDVTEADLDELLAWELAELEVGRDRDLGRPCIPPLAPENLADVPERVRDIVDECAHELRTDRYYDDGTAEYTGISSNVAWCELIEDSVFTACLSLWLAYDSLVRGRLTSIVRDSFTHMFDAPHVVDHPPVRRRLAAAQSFVTREIDAALAAAPKDHPVVARFDAFAEAVWDAVVDFDDQHSDGYGDSGDDAPCDGFGDSDDDALCDALDMLSLAGDP